MKSELNVIPLPPAFEPAWRLSIAGVQYSQPAFTHLLYSMMNRDQSRHVYWFTDSSVVPTLGTDGSRIYANPVYYFGLTLAQQIFASCHEVLHAAWRHPQQSQVHIDRQLPVKWKGKELPFDHATANIAKDYVVNATLVEANVGELKPGWYYHPGIATSRTSWQEAYHKIYETCMGGGGAGDLPLQDGDGNPVPGPGQMVDVHLPPGISEGKSPSEAAQEDRTAEWQVAFKAAQAAAEKTQMGTLPAELVRAFTEFLEPKVEWHRHVEGFLARRLGGGGYDWQRADRRLAMRRIYAPARSGKGCNILVVGADSSGSIYDVKGLVERLFAETAGMCEGLRPRLVYVVWCDVKVQRVDEIVEYGDLLDCYYKGAKGGGGTSFVPVFEWIEREGITPDALVYLTDLDGRFPGKAPDYPVVWGSFGKRRKKAPFGETVWIETEVNT